MEIWKSIAGYEGCYEISNLGAVRSLERTVTLSTGKVQRVDARILKNEVSHKGYVRAALRDGKKATKYSVHRLVLQSFVGPCPFGMEACHIDGDSLNNRVENLRWDTAASNWNDRRIHGTASVGESHPMATIDSATAQNIREDLARGDATNMIAMWNGVSRNVIFNIKYGKTWVQA